MPPPLLKGGGKGTPAFDPSSDAASGALERRGEGGSATRVDSEYSYDEGEYGEEGEYGGDEGDEGDVDSHLSVSNVHALFERYADGSGHVPRGVFAELVAVRRARFELGARVRRSSAHQPITRPVRARVIEQSTSLNLAQSRSISRPLSERLVVTPWLERARDQLAVTSVTSVTSVAWHRPT